jgi:hypothetical protein
MARSLDLDELVERWTLLAALLTNVRPGIKKLING